MFIENVRGMYLKLFYKIERCNNLSVYIRSVLQTKICQKSEERETRTESSMECQII